MSAFWQGVKDAAGAFFSNPLRYLVDPANTTLEYQTKQMIKDGNTKEQIISTLENAGFKKGSLVRDVVSFVTHNFSLILTLAILVLIVVYIVPLFRLRKANA